MNNHDADEFKGTGNNKKTVFFQNVVQEKNNKKKCCIRYTVYRSLKSLCLPACDHTSIHQESIHVRTNLYKYTFICLK